MTEATIAWSPQTAIAFCVLLIAGAGALAGCIFFVIREVRAVEVKGELRIDRLLAKFEQALHDTKGEGQRQNGVVEKRIGDMEKVIVSREEIDRRFKEQEVSAQGQFAAMLGRFDALREVIDQLRFQVARLADKA